MDRISRYYDDVPQWIRNMSVEELNKRIQEKRFAELAA